MSRRSHRVRKNRTFASSSSSSSPDYKYSSTTSSTPRSTTYSTSSFGTPRSSTNPRRPTTLREDSSSHGSTDFSTNPSPYVSGPLYRPLSVRRSIHRDWDLYDDYWADRRYFMSPLARRPTQNNQSMNHRYYYVDPPYGLWWNYPALAWHPTHSNRQVALMEEIDPLYSRRYRDPSYDRPVWSPTKKWPSDQTGYRLEPRRIVEMYRQKLIDYDTLTRTWLAPFSLERKIAQYRTEPERRQREEEEQEKMRRRRSTTRARSVGRYG